jgi:hypothetical protein
MLTTKPVHETKKTRQFSLVNQAKGPETGNEMKNRNPEETERDQRQSREKVNLKKFNN